MAKVCEIIQAPCSGKPRFSLKYQDTSASCQTFTRSVSGLKPKVSGLPFGYPLARFVPSISLVSTRFWLSLASKSV